MTNYATTCRSRSFVALLATQFFGALNDNLFKIMVSLFAIDLQLKAGSGIWGLIVLNLVFMSPYVIFSPLAGVLADSYSKAKLAKQTKILELVIMVVAWYFFWTGSFGGLLLVLFFMGLQSTLFSPAKYGILPEMLDDKYISRGNGYLNGLTFVAIIFGTALGGIVRELTPGSHWAPGIAVVVVAIIGLFTSLGIAKTVSTTGEAPKSEWSPHKVFAVIREMNQERGLILTLAAVTYFWFIGAMYQLCILLYGRTQLGLGETQTALLITALGVGIGIGSVVSGLLSRGKIRLDFAPVAGIVMGAAGLFLFEELNFAQACAVFFVLGFAAGFYTVPLLSYIQRYSPDSTRGRFIAATNFVSFVAMIVSSFLLLALVDVCGLKPHQVFQVTSVMSIFVMLYLVPRIRVLQRDVVDKKAAIY